MAVQKNSDNDMLRKEYPFEHHFLELGPNKVKMHYADEGSGPVILMLHAFPFWSFEYRKLILAFSGRYRVIAPDLVGYGLSDKPDDYDYRLENQINDIEFLIETLKLENITLILHGWGGMVGSGVMTRHASRIARIAVINTIAFSGFKLPLRLQILRICPKFAAWILIRWKMLFAGLYKYPESVRRGYLLPYRTRRSRIAFLHFVNNIPCKPEDPSYESILDIEYDLWQIRDKPMCIIWAMDDWLYPPQKTWRKLCPEAHFFSIRHAGRYIFEDASRDVIAIISSFMKEEGRPSLR